MQSWLLALAQIDPIPWAIRDNEALIRAAHGEAKAAGAKLVVTPELALSGYPPRDGVLHSGFLEACDRSLRALARLTESGPAMVVGAPRRRNGHQSGLGIANAAVVLAEGQILAEIDKRLLPNYDVFEEPRTFDPGGPQAPVAIAGRRIGITICEDLWIVADERPEVPRYAQDPARDLVQSGAELILNLSASPWSFGRTEDRLQLVQKTSERLRVPVALCNLVGGFEELLFDGASVCVNTAGSLLARAPVGESCTLCVDPFAAAPSTAHALWPEPMAGLETLLARGIRDYVRRSGFEQVLLGLSGGIDSALVASLAVRALGSNAVLGVLLPSEFSSEGSLTDARDLCDRLNIQAVEVPITGAWRALQQAVQSADGVHPFGILEENLQSRARGAILMGIANRSGRLLLTTGNKSELAVGYCTLYGDMCGALAPIGDLWKTEVFALAARDVERGRIPRNSLVKPPSAELRPGQVDEDSLPPYERLDRILKRFVILGESIDDVLAKEPDVDRKEAERIHRLLHQSEWKRRQAAPCLRVSRKAFGTGRKIPLVRGLNF